MSKKLTWIGIAITATYLIAVGLLGWGEWDKFSGMEPNLVGDFLAGVVGPLALLWLILGYFQQGEELKQSTEALRLQAEELRNSVLQQQALVEVTRKQAEAQLEAFRRDREEQKRAVSPLFVLAFYGGYARGNSQNYSFRLRNHGATVTDVTISLEGRPELPGPMAAGVLEHGAERDFSFTDQLDNRDPVTVRVTFMDGSGHLGAHSFRITFALGAGGSLNETSIVQLPNTPIATIQQS
ncbi:hypothetical protein A7J67_18375 [Achromobacter xylosoxidans]|nr:hypothetical protein A7J67_18375 [Achromobacter xylosoxidans]